MAKIIFEKREFTDRNSGIKTEYDYIAIAGTGDDTHKYEVQLKNLVQSEKMALQMIADKENGSGTTVEARKATVEENNEFLDNYKEKNKTDEDNFLDE